MNTSNDSTAAETFCIGFGDTRIGTALVAQSGKGIAAIFLGDDPAKLRRDVASAFPGVGLREDRQAMSDVVAAVVAFIDAPQQGLDVRLDLRGTVLQRATWEALRTIPCGETRTYGALAKTLPVPTTAQEVGAACAANVLAVAIPCHRVVKADGSISGYRWGVARKRRLINREAVA